MKFVMGGLVMATGCVSVVVGMAVAMYYLNRARRTYHRTVSLSAAAPEEWGSWFLGGFSSLTMGIRWLYAIAAWLALTLAGMGVIGLGIRLFGRW